MYDGEPPMSKFYWASPFYLSNCLNTLSRSRRSLTLVTASVASVISGLEPVVVVTVPVAVVVSGLVVVVIISGLVVSVPVAVVVSGLVELVVVVG